MKVAKWLSFRLLSGLAAAVLVLTASCHGGHSLPKSVDFDIHDMVALEDAGVDLHFVPFVGAYPAAWPTGFELPKGSLLNNGGRIGDRQLEGGSELLYVHGVSGSSAADTFAALRQSWNASALGKGSPLGAPITQFDHLVQGLKTSTGQKQVKFAIRVTSQTRHKNVSLFTIYITVLPRP